MIRKYRRRNIKEGFHRADMQDAIRNMENDFAEIKRIVNRNVSGYDDELYDYFRKAASAIEQLDNILVTKYDPDRY